MRGRYAEAEAVARRALELDLEPLEAAFFHGRIGVIERLLGRPRQALDSYLAGERVLDGVVDRDSAWWERWIGLKLDQAHFFYFENDQEAHGAALDELEPAVAAHGTPAQRLDLMHARMQYRYRSERYALSEETEALAREIYELDRASGIAIRDFTLGFCLLWRGKLDEAETHLERGLDSARHAGTALFEVRCLVYGLLVMRRRNDVERARARLAQLESYEELHGYQGLISACAAWVAHRDGDSDRAVQFAEVALGEWGSEGRLGYGVFQWTARFPLLGVALARGDDDHAFEHARAMLDQRQQPLPGEIAAAVERAVATGRVDDLVSACEVARPWGYA
jgi:tetratricopeptide (TPR) repeat protein